MSDKLVSICIPSRDELFLQKTTQDVLDKATGEIELFVVLNDQTEPVEEIKDKRLKYIRLTSKNGETLKRQSINLVSEISQGKYLMWLDAHCMMAKGFDEQLIKDHQDNWVQIPRRNRLDPEKWSLQPQSDDRPPIDYEYTMFPLKFDPPGLHGFKWDARTLERWDIPLDETMTCQASCIFMTKEWFKKNGFMRLDGYSGWGQESEEVCFTTWLRGGKVMTNKKTSYSHLHKGSKFGRMYFMTRDSMRKCNEFSYDFWLNDRLTDRIHNFGWLIDKFSPLPGWPKNWREQLGYKG